MANDDSDKEFLVEEIEDAINHFQSESSHQQASETRINALLARQLSHFIQGLSSTVGASASQLTQALNEFRVSMDKSSDTMARLTRWLVGATNVLAVVTAVLAFKDLDIHGLWAAVQSWLQ